MFRAVKDHLGNTAIEVEIEENQMICPKLRVPERWSAPRPGSIDLNGRLPVGSNRVNGRVAAPVYKPNPEHFDSQCLSDVSDQVSVSKRDGVALCGEAWRLCLPPRHEVFDAGSWVAVEDGAQGSGEVVDGVHA